MGLIDAKCLHNSTAPTLNCFILSSLFRASSVRRSYKHYAKISRPIRLVNDQFCLLGAQTIDGILFIQLSAAEALKDSLILSQQDGSFHQYLTRAVILQALKMNGLVAFQQKWNLKALGANCKQLPCCTKQYQRSKGKQQWTTCTSAANVFSNTRTRPKRQNIQDYCGLISHDKLPPDLLKLHLFLLS